MEYGGNRWRVSAGSLVFETPVVVNDIAGFGADLAQLSPARIR